MRFLFLLNLVFCGTFALCAQTQSSECPKLILVSPAGVINPGDTMSFEVRIEPPFSGLKYEWSISRGAIESGQGTHALTVRTFGEDEKERIDVTVQVFGLPAGCGSNATDYGMVAPLPDSDGMLIDEFGDIKPNDFRGRLDNFFIQLNRNPDYDGFILFSVTKKEVAGLGNPRLKLLIKHAKFRKFDLTRLVVYFEREDRVRTRMFCFKNDSTPLSCPNCITLYGRDLK